MLEKLNLVIGGKKNLTDNFFLCFGEINTEVASNAVEWIIGNNFSEEPPEVMTMIINSPGGSLTDAWAIIDVMRGSTIPIRVIGLGQICSAGLLIFSAGQKGNRIMTENTSIMSHQYYWGSSGKFHELLAVQKEVDFTQERLIKHFKKVTGMKEDEINKYLMPPHDVYLTAQDAKKFGLCDIVKPLN